MRGSGGVGVLVREELLDVYTVEVLDRSAEDKTWVHLKSKQGEGDLVGAVCYVPPEASSRGKSEEETFGALEEQVQKFGTLGTLVICGVFNARCGDLVEEEAEDEVPGRRPVDTIKNWQGEALMSFLGNSGLYIVNGRIGRDGFTCVSGRGSSVLDYCILPREQLKSIIGFRVVTMRESLEEMHFRGEGMRIPDHSILMWNLQLEGPEYWTGKEKNWNETKKTTFIVSENYLENDSEEIRKLVNKVKVSRSQKNIDEVYKEVTTLLRSRLKQVTWRSDQKRQPWFSKELGKLRRKFHIAEKEWLHCRGKKEHLVKRGHYLEIRRNYKKAVGRTKRAYVEKRGQDMERLLKQPRKW